MKIRPKTDFIFLPLLQNLPNIYYNMIYLSKSKNVISNIIYKFTITNSQGPSEEHGS